MRLGFAPVAKGVLLFAGPCIAHSPSHLSFLGCAGLIRLGGGYRSSAFGCLPRCVIAAAWGEV